MAKPKTYLWECPHGIHPAVRAPSRPRRDDVRRFCLKCSEASGHLVERSAPALVRKRTEKTESARARARKRQTKARKAALDQVSVNGINLQKCCDAWVKLKVFGGPKGLLAMNPPELHVHQRTTYARSQLGHCAAGGWDVHVSVEPGDDGVQAVNTLIHELAHAYVERYGRRPTRTRHINGRHQRISDSHGDLWQSLYRDAVKEIVGRSEWPEHAYSNVLRPGLKKANKNLIDIVPKRALNPKEDS